MILTGRGGACLFLSERPHPRLFTPAILLTVGAKLWKGPAARRPDAHLLALRHADVMPMDSDKG